MPRRCGYPHRYGHAFVGVTSRFTLCCCSFLSPSRTWGGGCLGPQGHLDTEDPPEQKSQCKEWALGGVRCHARPWRWQIRGQEAGREAPMEVQTGDGQMTEKGLQSIIYAIYPQGLSELGKCKSSLAQGGCWPTTSKALAPYPHPLPRARPCVTPCFLPKHSSLEPGQVETSVYINIYHSWQLSH